MQGVQKNPRALDEAAKRAREAMRPFVDKLSKVIDAGEKKKISEEASEIGLEAARKVAPEYSLKTAKLQFAGMKTHNSPRVVLGTSSQSLDEEESASVSPTIGNGLAAGPDQATQTITGDAIPESSGAAEPESLSLTDPSLPREPLLSPKTKGKKGIETGLMNVRLTPPPCVSQGASGLGSVVVENSNGAQITITTLAKETKGEKSQSVTVSLRLW